MIFWQKSLPRPNSSRTISTMSSAWLSSLAKTSVLGTSVRPGKMSVKRRSRNARTTVRDLVARHHAAVELGGVVGDVLVGPFPAPLARLPVAVLDHRVGRGLDRGSLPGDPRADVIHLEVHVHAVGHGALVVVLHDQVLVEEPEGMLRGASR